MQRTTSNLLKMKYKCSCCQKHVEEKNIKKTASILPFDGLPKMEGQTPLQGFLAVIKNHNLYQWACDDCHQSKKAILGNPRKQFYTFKNPWDSATPYLAYFDKNFTCKTCGEDFVFAKEEQQHWYEKLNFVVYSKPVNCPSCRKEIRDAKNLNTELSGLLKDGDPKDKNALIRIAEIYDILEKPEKAKAYRRAAEKLG